MFLLVASLAAGAFPAPSRRIAGAGRRDAHRIDPAPEVMLTIPGELAERRELPVTAKAAAAQLSYHGGYDGIGVTTGTPKVYLVFWGSQWGSASTGGDGSVQLSGDPQGIAPRLQALFRGIGSAGEQWSGVMTQYCEGVAAGSTSCPPGAPHVGYPKGGALAGVWIDTRAPALTNAAQWQLASEATAAAAHFGNTSAGSNRSAQYVVVSPSGTHPDGFNTNRKTGQFCAWHTFTYSNYGDLAYTNLPYVPDAGWSCGGNYVNAGPGGTLDGVTIVEGHEYAETLTDQNIGGWYDGDGSENADKCAWNGVGGPGGLQNVAFSTGTFAMQGTWANDAGACRISRPAGLANDFSLTPSTASFDLVQRTAAPMTFSTAVTSGSAVPVALQLAGLPAGVTGTFASRTVTSGSDAALTLTAGSVTPGTYTVTVKGVASGPHAVTRSATFVLNVLAANDFSIVPASSSLTITPGTSATDPLSTSVTRGAAIGVRWQAYNLPRGVTSSFGAAAVTAGGSTNLNVVVAASAAPGTYTIRVTGIGTSNGAAIARSVYLTLTITARAARR